MKVTGAKLECLYCGELLVVPDKDTGKKFMLVYKKFVRKHDWHCESNAKAKAYAEKFKSDVNAAVFKAMKG
jgi:hypothetical protein